MSLTVLTGVGGGGVSSLATTSSTASPGCCRSLRACCWLIPGSRGLPFITRIWSRSCRRPSLQTQRARRFSKASSDTNVRRFFRLPLCYSSRLDVFDEDSLTAGPLGIQTDHAEAQTPGQRPGQAEQLSATALRRDGSVSCRCPCCDGLQFCRFNAPEQRLGSTHGAGRTRAGPYGRTETSRWSGWRKRGTVLVRLSC